MIAYRVHYDPTWNKIVGINRIRQTRPGPILRGGFYGQQPAGAWRLNKKLAGGGALMDLGIYPLNGNPLPQRRGAFRFRHHDFYPRPQRPFRGNGTVNGVAHEAAFRHPRLLRLFLRPART